jgi:hypothetical protein
MKSKNKQTQRWKLQIPVLDKHFEVAAKIIDESLILTIVLRNYSTKPSYIFQLKCELKVWKYIN